jgi:hypothetical protein
MFSVIFTRAVYPLHALDRSQTACIPRGIASSESQFPHRGRRLVLHTAKRALRCLPTKFNKHASEGFEGISRKTAGLRELKRHFSGKTGVHGRTPSKKR